MKQKINLSISKPCSENFDQFKQTKSGGFCGSCKKEVIDFTNMSDKQLIKFLKHKKGNTCGYFNASQINKDIEVVEFKESNKYNFLRVAAVAVISLMSLHNIQAQTEQPKTEIIQKTKKEQKNTTQKEEPSSQLITGIVSDETTLLPGVNILLKGTSIGTTTNFHGEFEFPKKLEKGDVLIVSYIGYKSKNITIKQEQSPLNIVMNEGDLILMGEVEVNEVYKSKPSLWQKIKSIF